MSTYRPFDQKMHLEGPPWHSGPELEAWEEAHGHDIRVRCYVEYGCKALDNHYEELKEAIREHEHTVRSYNDMWDGEDGGPSIADLKLWATVREKQ